MKAKNFEQWAENTAVEKSCSPSDYEMIKANYYQAFNILQANKYWLTNKANWQHEKRIEITVPESQVAAMKNLCKSYYTTIENPGEGLLWDWCTGTEPGSFSLWFKNPESALAFGVRMGVLFSCLEEKTTVDQVDLFSTNYLWATIQVLKLFSTVFLEQFNLPDESFPLPAGYNSVQDAKRDLQYLAEYCRIAAYQLAGDPARTW